MSASNRRSRVLLQAIMATGVIAALALAAQADLPITQIAITGDPAPDGGTFATFCAPTTDRQTPFNTGVNPFYFEATTSNGSSGATGIYYYTFSNTTGQLVATGTVADTTMTVPQGGAIFTGFSNLSSGFGELGFLATDSNSNNQSSVYAIGAFPLTLIATPQTLTPSGVPFGNFQSISISGSQVYGSPGGEIENDSGIYDFDFYGGPVGQSLEFTLVANTSTVPPGASGPFTSFGPVSFKNQINGFDDYPGITGISRAVRATVDGVEGIYWGLTGATTGTGYPLRIINEAQGETWVPIQVGSPNPDDTGVFTSFGNPIATTNEILFTAHYSTASGDQQGIFVFAPYESLSEVGPTFQQIVATGQVAPDSGGATFTNFCSLSDGSFYEVFLACLSDGKEGLYLSQIANYYSGDLSITKVLETGDTYDGKTIAGIELSPDASEYEYYEYYCLTVLELDFTDGSQGLYYFNLPEPSSLSLLGLPLLLISRRRRPRNSSPKQVPSMIEPLEPDKGGAR